MADLPLDKSAGDVLKAAEVNALRDLGYSGVINAGEVISGATLPVPVYQNKSDAELYICDANDTDKMKFIGFVITDGVDAGAVTFQGNGIVGGFSGMTPGEKYYLQDAAGTIGTTPGTNTVLVGVAITATLLLIQKGGRQISGTFDTNGTETLTITCGFRITELIMQVTGHSDTTYSGSHSTGGWTKEGGNNCVYLGFGASNNSTPFNSNIECFFIKESGTDTIVGVINNITDISFDIEITETNSVIFAFGHYIARGEL